MAAGLRSIVRSEPSCAVSCVYIFISQSADAKRKRKRTLIFQCVATACNSLMSESIADELLDFGRVFLCIEMGMPA